MDTHFSGFLILTWVKFRTIFCTIVSHLFDNGMISTGHLNRHLAVLANVERKMPCKRLETRPAMPN